MSVESDFQRQAIVTHVAQQLAGPARAITGFQELMTEHARDLGLEDLMPEMDGFETLNEMQQIPELQNIPVVVVTSKDLSAKELNWLRDRAVAVVTKGANSRSQLVEALERQISARDSVSADIGHA